MKKYRYENWPGEDGYSLFVKLPVFSTEENDQVGEINVPIVPKRSLDYFKVEIPVTGNSLGLHSFAIQIDRGTYNKLKEKEER